VICDLIHSSRPTVAQQPTPAHPSNDQRVPATTNVYQQRPTSTAPEPPKSSLTCLLTYLLTCLLTWSLLWRWADEHVWAYGWTMAYGLRLTAYGLWLMAHGWTGSSWSLPTERRPCSVLAYSARGKGTQTGYIDWVGQSIIRYGHWSCYIGMEPINQPLHRDGANHGLRIDRENLLTGSALCAIQHSHV